MSDQPGSSGTSQENEKKVEKTTEEVEEQDEDDQEAVTMLDVLEEENDLEDDANAVLGGSDDQNCTYSEGYVPRQALYACMTCVPVTSEDFKPAGVCLACSLNCHEGHELVELYTKRNFKCDCGNSKFGEKKCSLQPEKAAENGRNEYNQNFRGVYCVCKRPYPDPEDTTDDEMVQCIVCEDWYHGRHLDLPPNMKITSHNFAEMICGTCMETNSFLFHYAEEFAVSGENTHDVSIDVVSDERPEGATETKSVDTLKNGTGTKENGSKKGEISEDLKEVAEEESAALANEAKEEQTTSKEVKEESSTSKTAIDETKAEEEKAKTAECYLTGKERSGKKETVLWPTGWRKNLCTCKNCKDMYEEKKLSFLCDEDDMVQAYEEAGKQRRAASGTQYEQGLRALSSLDRIRQMEAIQEYNKMQAELKEFLADFAAKKRVVTKDDIEGFFADLTARKKRRTETGSVPYFCH